jgi:dipeptidyl aminopeptidase/acylaminoacyl peptidase
VQLKIKADFKDIAPENNIAKTKAQILIVHGKIDPIVPFEHAERLYAGRDKQKTELLALDGVNHSNYEDNPEFWPAMEKFLCSPFPD